MSKRYFTVEEANRMIPRLEQVFGRMLQLHAQIREIHTRLAGTGFSPGSDEFDIAPAGAPPQVLSDLTSLRTLVDALKQDVLSLSESGCVVKGVDTGLVDWYARLRDRDVFLCWKLGEKSLGYWHEIEDGYAGRRPLSEFVEAGEQS